MIAGLPREVRLADQLLLRDRDALDRDLDAEIAARDHDAVGRREDLVDPGERGRALDLGEDQRLTARRARRGAHRQDVGGGLHEGLTDRVNPLADREFQAFLVALGEGVDRRDRGPAG